MKLLLTFEQARNRIIQAYYKDELDPFKNGACFVGNLLGNRDEWSYARVSPCFVVPGTNTSIYGKNPKTVKHLQAGLQLINEHGYTAKQITAMENNFLTIICVWHKGKSEEDVLFDAMDSTIDMLRKIHIQNGEVIPEPFVFAKRQLAVA
jgi:hypothetical protein